MKSLKLSIVLFLFVVSAVWILPTACNQDTIPVTGISLNKSTTFLLVGKMLVLDAVVEPADATNKTVTWNSNDNSIATINSAGEITGVAGGTVTITATTEDGKFMATCTVTVIESSITMTTRGSWICFGIEILEESENLTIDWGDGKKSKITDAIRNNERWFSFCHEYQSASERHITIGGVIIMDLSCGENNLTALDVSRATMLTSLDCEKNYITALDVSKNIALTYLNCQYNQLTNLDVSGATALTYLNCSYNKLPALDVSRNTELTTLDCRRNKLTALNVSLNSTLSFLDCSTNQLNFLDLTYNSELVLLCLCYNGLTNLDVSANTMLLYLCCMFNNLTANVLNDLFRTLPYIPGYGGWIEIWGNPGEHDCDRSIVDERGWKFDEDLHFSCQHTCWDEWR